MDLLAYFAFVAVAVGGLYFLLVRMGRHDDAAIDEATAAAALVQIVDLDPPIGPVIKARNAVLFPCAEGKLAVVRAMGHHPTVTVLRAADIRKIDDAPGELLMHLTDYATPMLRLKTDAPEQLRDVISHALRQT